MSSTYPVQTGGSRAGCGGTRYPKPAVFLNPASSLIATFLVPLLALWALAMGGARAEIFPPGCTGNGQGITLFVDKATAHVGDTLRYSLLVSNEVFPACRAQEIVTAIVTPDGVTHPITLRRTTLMPGESDLYENVVSYVIRAQDIQNGRVRGEATSTAIINQNISNEIARNFRDVNTVIATPNIAIEAACVGGVGEGAPITFSGVVRNTGNIGLAGVAVTNTFNGQIVFGPATLNPGQSAEFTGSFVPADGCAGSATLATGGTSMVTPPRTVSASATVQCANTTTPAIELIRACPPTPPVAGTPLSFTGIVRNTGNVTLRDIRVVSDRPAANTVVFTLESLAPGAEATFTGSYPTAADACSVTDTMVATGVGRCSGQTVSNSKTTTCPLSATGEIDLTIQCPAAPPTVGGSVVYAGRVTNPGAVTLNNIVVVADHAPGTPVFTLATLAPGASATFSVTVAVPADACSVSASFTATASDRCGGTGIMDKATATCPVATAPAIAVTHECPTTPLRPGQSGNFAGTVRNTGNVTLQSVTVVSGETVLLGPIALAPGASATFTGTVLAPADACSVSTSVTARGIDQCSEQVVTNTSTRTCPVETTAAIELLRECPPELPTPGGALVYTGRVQNTGDVTLTEVVVRSGNTTIFGPVTLAPGASSTFSHQTVAPATGCSVTTTWVATGRNQCTNATVSRERALTCPLTVLGSVNLTLACPSGELRPGANATYNATVRNTGSVALRDVVVVSSSNPGQPVFTLAQLNPGESRQFNWTIAVPSNICDLTTVLSVSAEDECGGRGVTDETSVTCVVAASPAIVVSHACPTTSLRPGQSAPFGGTVRNSGDVTLTGVTVRQGDTIVFGPGTLEPGQSAEFQGVVAVSADACSVTTTLHASAISKCRERQVTSSSSQTCPVTTAPGLRLVMSCPPSVPAAGGELLYSGSLENTGDVALTGVTVRTPGGTVFGPISLAPGATAPFTHRAAAPAGVCSVTTAWTATATNPCGGPAITQTQTTVCTVQTDPRVALTLSCPSRAGTPGQPITLSGTVRNTGSITLTNVAVLRLGAESEAPVFTRPSLAPGATASFNITVTVPANVCSVTTTLRVTAQDLCLTRTAEDTAATDCPITTSPAVAITHECPTESAMPGLPTVFGGRVSNTGNITLTNVVVRHALAGSTPVFGPATLDPGQSLDFTGSYVVPEDISGCSYQSQVTVTANGRCDGRVVQATNSRSCSLQFLPGIEVVMDCPPGPVAQGQRLRYTGTVRNVGNVELREIRITNSRTGDSRVESFSRLAVGQSRTFSGSFTVDNGCCDITSTLRVTAVDTCGQQTVTDTFTKTCPVIFNPRIAVTKTCPTTAVEPGGTLTFNGTVSNPGDVALVDVYVRNVVKNTASVVLGPIVLAPGQTVNFSHSYVVPEDFCGDDQLVAVGDSICGQVEGITASVATRCPVRTSPAVFVVKHCPTAPVAPGGVFTFTGTVINGGDVGLTDVIVVNNMPRAGTQVFGPVTLAPGESRDFTASYTLEANCCDTVDVLEVRARNRCSGQSLVNTGAAACQVRWNPAIQVSLDCQDYPNSPGLDEGGSSFQRPFKGQVRNTGDITLRNVTVTAGLLNGVAPTSSGTSTLLGPIELAPGEVKSFSGMASGGLRVTARGTSLCRAETVTDVATCFGGSGEGGAGLNIVSLTNGDGRWTLRWQAEAGRSYRVEVKSALSDGAWEPLADPIVAPGSIGEFKDDEPTGLRFYRVVLMPDGVVIPK